VIKRFGHKGLERLFLSGDLSGVSAQHEARLRPILALLNASKTANDLGLPGLRLHPLRGSRRGHWAVSENLRLVFEFDGEDAANVDLVDCH
jgi:proteic killer suppression protein